MAFWVGGGNGIGPYVTGGKRRVSHSDGSDVDFATARGPDGPVVKRSRISDINFCAVQPPEPIQVNNVTFLVIQQRSPSLEPDLEAAVVSSCAMERTASGLSISSDTTFHPATCLDGTQILADADAAWLVGQHMGSCRRRSPDSQHERILRSLIQPKSKEAEFSLDNDALRSIFSAANELFFYNRLAGRVTWDWSHSSSPQYQEQIIGTTALRRSKLGGYETLIVLSQPILKDKKYSRRLLISTFLHELIHSYLFICCGFKARACGGHTAGFRRIAGLIDDWAGPDNLHLKDMEADLNRFRETDVFDEAQLEDERHPYHHHYDHGRDHGHNHAQLANSNEYFISFPQHHHHYQRHQTEHHHQQYHYQHHEYPAQSDSWDHAIHDGLGEMTLCRSMSNATGSSYVY
jgi:hypothetical protein